MYIKLTYMGRRFIRVRKSFEALLHIAKHKVKGADVNELFANGVVMFGSSVENRFVALGMTKSGRARSRSQSESISDANSSGRYITLIPCSTGAAVSF